MITAIMEIVKAGTQEPFFGPNSEKWLKFTKLKEMWKKNHVFQLWPQ